MCLNGCWGVDCLWEVWDGLEEGRGRLTICVRVLKVGGIRLHKGRERDWDGLEWGKGERAKRERLEIFDILKIAKEGYEKFPVKISKIEFSSYLIFQVLS